MRENEREDVHDALLLVRLVRPRQMAAVARGLRDCARCRSRPTCTAAGSARVTPLPPVPDRSAFRRPLPLALVAFSSREGRRLFGEAMRDGQLEPYFPLAEQFVTQSEPMFCGLGTLTMVKINNFGVFFPFLKFLVKQKILDFSAISARK